MTFDHSDSRSELRDVLLMSAPMVVTTCSPLVMRLADFAFVSKLGTAAQAAILPSQMVLWCYTAMCMGLVSAVNALASQSLGRERHRDCSTYAWQALYMASGLGIIILGVRGVLPEVFAWIGHEADVQPLEVSYTQMGLFAILPTVLAHALGSFFVGVHRPLVTMRVAMEGNALNILLNYVLIFGHWGFPELGFTGAALGTVFAGWFQCARLLGVFLGPRNHNAHDSRHTWRPDGAKTRALLRVGVPQGIHWLSDVTVWGLFVTLLIGRFGQVELAASNIAWQYIRISFMPMIGVGEAVTALVGRCIGEDDKPRARRLVRTAIGVTFCYICSLSVVYVFARHALIGLFSDNADVVSIGARVMPCVAFFQLFDVLGTAFYFALRGAGDTAWPMVMFVVSHWTVLIGGGFIVVTLWPGFGIMGPWLVATFLISLSSLLLFWRWQSGAWEEISILAT